MLHIYICIKEDLVCVLLCMPLVENWHYNRNYRFSAISCNNSAILYPIMNPIVIKITAVLYIVVIHFPGVLYWFIVCHSILGLHGRYIWTKAGKTFKF